jgi:uncharacterized protein (TIGR03643 family)
MSANLSTYCYYSDLPSPLAYMQDEERPSKLSEEETHRIIEMAWEDKTPFDAIKLQFGLCENEVKALMKNKIKFRSYILWRKRVENCKTKHVALRLNKISRFRSKSQRAISLNKISKRK